jgi:SAM-dependent methyltransferase
MYDLDEVKDNYRELLELHGSGPAVGQWSEEGQRFRFQKLTEIADLGGSRILEIGCGIGDFYPFIVERFGDVTYTGIDIVPELIDQAAKIHTTASFRCVDVLKENLADRFDYVFLSGVFNYPFPGVHQFMYDMVSAAYSCCDKGLGFNFISSYVNQMNPKMAYHDPHDVFRHCLEKLSRKTTIQHHYERCDVAVYVYR